MSDLEKEPYQPTPKEEKKAKDMMTDEQKEERKKRERIQEMLKDKGVSKGWPFGVQDFEKERRFEQKGHEARKIIEESIQKLIDEGETKNIPYDDDELIPAVMRPFYIDEQLLLLKKEGKEDLIEPYATMVIKELGKENKKLKKELEKK